MPLTQDITLNGVAYTVAPGLYKKKSRAAAGGAAIEGQESPARERRIVLDRLGRGQRQAFRDGDDDAGAGWDSLGVGPSVDGAGVQTFPSVAPYGDLMSDVPGVATRCYGVVAGANAFIGVGRRIYKSVALSNGTWANLTAAADLGAGFTISGLAYYQDDLLVLLSSGQDIRKFNTATNSLTVWRSGERGVHGVGYAGQLVYAPLAANNQEELRLSGTRWNGNAVTHLRYLDAPIVRMAPFNGRVAIATRRSLYFMGGQPYPGEADDASVPADTSKAPEWRGDPEPVMTHGSFAGGDDFVFLEAYRGRLYTWLDGRVAEYDDSQEEGRWRRVGPAGVACYGATVSGDWLIVALTGRYGEQVELWGFNGEGWWLLALRASPAAIWPCPLAGAGNRDVLVFRDATTLYDLYRVKWRSSSLRNFGSSGAWTSPLLDAGDPTRDKDWLAVGATFAAPAPIGVSGSADSVTVTLEYSTDAGANWTQAATTGGVTDAATLTRALQSAFGAVPRSRYVQLRVSWTSVSDWQPVLTAVWAECRGVSNSPRKRRWELTVDASDRKVRRDGQRAANTGRQDVAALWDAWELNTAVSFQDVDNDADPVTYSVEIEEISEEIQKPGDAARWGESRVSLKLAEV